MCIFRIVGTTSLIETLSGISEATKAIFWCSSDQVYGFKRREYEEQLIAENEEYS